MVKFDAAELQELKNRNDLVEIIGRVTNLRKVGSVYRGPCPWCGGSPRATKFSVLPARQTYTCHQCGCGGDVIKFLQEWEGLSFPAAVEWLGGTVELSETDRKKHRKAAERKERDEARRVQKNRDKARAIWDETVDGCGTLVETYLRSRSIDWRVLPNGWPKALHFHPELPYWHVPNAGKPYIIKTCAAMVACIVGPDDDFMGVHCTWLRDDGRGKAKFLDDRGTVLPAKKVKGAQKGGSIRLSPRRARMLIGEGIETCLSAYLAVLAAGHADYSVWCGISLGNMAGSSVGSLQHPEHSARRIPSRTPDPDNAGFVPPDGVSEAIYLGDGDSDRAMTENSLFCAARRSVDRGLAVRIAFADPKTDFNDMVQRALR